MIEGLSFSVLIKSIKTEKAYMNGQVISDEEADGWRSLTLSICRLRATVPIYQYQETSAFIHRGMFLIIFAGEQQDNLKFTLVFVVGRMPRPIVIKSEWINTFHDQINSLLLRTNNKPIHDDSLLKALIRVFENKNQTMFSKIVKRFQRLWTRFKHS